MSKKVDHKPASRFSGVARSIICYNHMNMFRNFKIVTLTIENGVIVKEELSDPYNSAEVAAQLDLLNDKACINLNNEWQEGLAFRK